METQGSIQKTPDRRKALRSPIIVFKVSEGNAEQHLFGYAKNISRSGLFIQSVNPRKPGGRYTISFHIPEVNISIRCQCEVVWMREYREKSPYEPGYGVRFLDLSESVATAIDGWVHKKLFGLTTPR